MDIEEANERLRKIHKRLDQLPTTNQLLVGTAIWVVLTIGGILIVFSIMF